LLVGRFVTEFYRLVAEWADWAAAIVTEWPEDVARAEADRGQLQETVERAGWE
jgi:hypothetical protein